MIDQNLYSKIKEYINDNVESYLLKENKLFNVTYGKATFQVSEKRSEKCSVEEICADGAIEEELVSLNIELQQVLNKTDLEQYIRGAHYVFSELAHIHPFTDGNGRLVRYLIRILLAHRGIIAPAFYKEVPSSYIMDRGYVKFILENSLDITGCDRLHQKEEVMENENIDTSGYGI